MRAQLALKAAGATKRQRRCWAGPGLSLRSQPHNKAPGPEAQRPQVPWLPTAGSCSESLGCTKTKGHFCPAPPHAGEHSLCPLPSRPPGNKVKLGGRGLRTLRGRARGKPCPPPPRSRPPGMGTSAGGQGASPGTPGHTAGAAVYLAGGRRHSRVGQGCSGRRGQ